MGNAAPTEIVPEFSPRCAILPFSPQTSPQRSSSISPQISLAEEVKDYEEPFLNDQQPTIRGYHSFSYLVFVGAQQILAVCVAVLITLLDNFPYGFLLFPMSAELHGMGISMVLLSAAIAQLVFAWNSSLPEGLGCMIVENIPMLHSMANSVTKSLAASPEKIVPTVLALYISASLLTAVAFLLLGYFKMDRLFLLLPKPVLMGCIGGMGVYILTAGVGAATNVPWDWTAESLYQQSTQWQKVLVLCALEFLLLIVIRIAKADSCQAMRPFVLPVFFLGLVPATWALIWVSGLTHAQAQTAGVLYSNLPSTGGMLSHMQYMQFDQIAWWVFPDQLLLLLGIVVFSCLHVPVNVPALGLGTDRKPDINGELILHGVANLAAACLGTVQNYMVYSSSLLYFKCGGGSRPAGLAVAMLVTLCVPHMSQLLPFVPRILSGVLLMHLGVELIWESLVDTWQSLDTLEYIIVVCITGICNFSFMMGFLVGLLCACMAFAIQAARRDPVKSVFYPGRGLRSSKMRSFRELRILENYERGGGLLVLKLQGALFFGNTHTLPKRFENISCEVVILDFHHVVSVDSSAFSQLAAIASSLNQQGKKILCSGLLPELSLRARHQPELCIDHFFPDLNSAIESVEDHALTKSASTTHEEVIFFRGHTHGSVLPASAPSDDDCRFFDATCGKILEPMGLAHTSPALRSYFEFQCASAGTILWNPGDPADFAFLLVSGHVGVLDYHHLSLHQQESHGFVESSVPGQFTGELNLFTGEARKNQIVATKDLRMWIITRSSLERMQGEDLHLAFALQGIALRYASHRMHLSMLYGHVHTV